MSMVVIALLMRAWIVEMKQYAAQPRLLADDVQVISTGGRHLSNFEYAYNKTHLHLEEMGAIISPQKCNAFSSDPTSREWLRNYQWRRLGKLDAVIADCRDLGAHFNATVARLVGATLTQRMWKTANSTERLDKIKAPYEKQSP